MNSTEAEGDMAFCRKCTPIWRWRNKYNSSYQSEENNNPGLDLSSPVNDRGNYAHIVRQPNRITVRFSLWLGCHPPNYYCASWLILSFSLSIILLSLSLPVLFHLFVCLILLSLSPSTPRILSSSFSRLMNLKLQGIVSPGETSSLFGPYFLLHNIFTLWSAEGIQLSITLPQVPANTFTTFKLATVTTNHALASQISRCCRLPLPRLRL